MNAKDVLIEQAKEEYAEDGVLSLTTTVELINVGVIVDELLFHFEQESK